MLEYRICDLLNNDVLNYGNTGVPYDYTVILTVHYPDGGIYADRVIIPDNEFKNMITHLYTSWKLQARKKWLEVNQLTPHFEYTFEDMLGAIDFMHELHGTWKRDRYPAFCNLFKALVDAVYDPLSNYDKHSKITTDYKGSESNTNVPTGTETETESGTLTTEDDVTTYDSNTYNHNEKSIVTPTNRSSTLSFVNRQTVDTKSFTDRQDEVIEHTWGNIGVTTSQQMALSTIPLEDRNKFCQYICEDFVNYIGTL